MMVWIADIYCLLRKFIMRCEQCPLLEPFYPSNNSLSAAGSSSCVMVRDHAREPLARPWLEPSHEWHIRLFEDLEMQQEMLHFRTAPLIGRGMVRDRVYSSCDTPSQARRARGSTPGRRGVHGSTAP